MGRGPPSRWIRRTSGREVRRDAHRARRPTDQAPPGRRRRSSRSPSARNSTADEATREAKIATAPGSGVGMAQMPPGSERRRVQARAQQQAAADWPRRNQLQGTAPRYDQASDRRTARDRSPRTSATAAAAGSGGPQRHASWGKRAGRRSQQGGEQHRGPHEAGGVLVGLGAFVDEAVAAVGVSGRRREVGSRSARDIAGSITLGSRDRARAWFQQVSIAERQEQHHHHRHQRRRRTSAPRPPRSARRRGGTVIGKFARPSTSDQVSRSPPAAGARVPARREGRIPLPARIVTWATPWRTGTAAPPIGQTTSRPRAGGHPRPKAGAAPGESSSLSRPLAAHPAKPRPRPSTRSNAAAAAAAGETVSPGAPAARRPAPPRWREDGMPAPAPIVPERPHPYRAPR